MLLKNKTKNNVKIIVHKTENELVKHLKLDLDKQIKELIYKGFSKDEIKESDLSLNIGGNFFPKLEYVHIKFNFVFSSILKKLGKYRDNCIYYKINCNNIYFFKNVDFEFKEKNSDYSLSGKNYIFFNEVNMYYSHFENELNFSNIIFKDNFFMTYSFFKNGITFYKVDFNKKLCLHTSSFNNKIYFSNSSFNDEIDFIDNVFFCDINFNDIYYINSILLDNIQCIDDNIKLFISTNRRCETKGKISYISLENALLYKVVFKDCDIDNINLIGSYINNFELINSDFNNFKNWQTARILKNEEVKKSNNIKALEYQADEIRLYKKELKDKFKKEKTLKNLGDIISIELSSLYSDNGQNWLKAFGLTILLPITFFMLSYLPSSYIILFSVILSLLYIMLYIKKVDIYIFSSLIFYLLIVIINNYNINLVIELFNFMNPTSLEQLKSGSYIYKDIPIIRGFLYFFGKISFWYGSVQTVQAFRKFSKGL